MSYFPKFGNPVGFVYFDNSANNSTGLSESFDYIEFNSGSPKGNFSPSGSSSPQQFHKRNNYRGKCNNKRYNRYHNGNNNYRHPRNSFNNSYNNSISPKHVKQNDNDMSAYYHPSMIEDPWAELEREMDPDIRDNCERSDVDSSVNIVDAEDENTDSQDESQESS